MNRSETDPGGAEEFSVVSGRADTGATIFSVLVKRSYDIIPAQRACRSERTNPLVKIDEYYDHGDPEWATVKYETDLVPYKLATDVVVIGKAYAPKGNPVTQLDVSVEIARSKKTIRVTGDRRCVYRQNRTPLFAEPAPFTQMEIRYEKAYGGRDTKSNPDVPFFYPRNTMGTGVVIKNMRETVDDLLLPNLEYPDDLLTPERILLGEPERWNQQPLPAGFGWFQPTWYPRCSHAGAIPGFVDLEEELREEKLGLVPKGQIALARQFKLPSFDTRFNNGASLGLALPYLSGNEHVRMAHLTPEGQLDFLLPDDPPEIVLNIGLGENVLKSSLHTVCVRLEDKQVDLVWRGAHEYPGVEWLPEMKQMVAHVS